MCLCWADEHPAAMQHGTTNAAAVLTTATAVVVCQLVVSTAALQQYTILHVAAQIISQLTKNFIITAHLMTQWTKDFISTAQQSLNFLVASQLMAECTKISVTTLKSTGGALVRRVQSWFSFLLLWMFSVASGQASRNTKAQQREIDKTKEWESSKQQLCLRDSHAQQRVFRSTSAHPKVRIHHTWFISGISLLYIVKK